MKFIVKSFVSFVDETRKLLGVCICCRCLDDDWCKHSSFIKIRKLFRTWAKTFHRLDKSYQGLCSVIIEWYEMSLNCRIAFVKSTWNTRQQINRKIYLLTSPNHEEGWKVSHVKFVLFVCATIQRPAHSHRLVYTTNNAFSVVKVLSRLKCCPFVYFIIASSTLAR